MVLTTLLALQISAYTWKNVEIGGGGFVTGIITHPRKKDLVYARTDIGGIYRLDPKTRRWIPLQDFLTRDDWNLYGAESVALDPNDPSRVYVASGTYTNDWAGNGAMLWSKDAGRHWNRVDLPFKNGGNHDGRSMGERLAVNPTNGKHILFGTRKAGLWESKDGAATWQKAPFSGDLPDDNQGIQWTLFAPDGKSVYLGTTIPGQRIWRSLDNGKRWDPIAGQPEMIPHQAKWTSDGELVIVYGNGPGPNGITDGAVYRYAPKASTWTEITPEKPGPGNTFGYAGVTVDPKNPKHIMVSTMDRWAQHDTVFRTTDGGVHWQSLKDMAKMDASESPFLRWDREEADFGHWIGDVEIDPFNPNRVWYVTGATIWGTDNLSAVDAGKPADWRPRAFGLEETAVLDLVSPPVGPPVISALGDIGGFRHDDLTRSPARGIWRNPVLNTVTDIDFAGQQPNWMVRVGNGNGPKFGGYSSDGGVTWTPFNTNPTDARAGTIAIGADGKTIVWASGKEAKWSIDQGASWKSDASLPGSARVISSKVTPNRFFAYSASDGEVYKWNGEAFIPVGKATLGARQIVVPFDRDDLWLPASTGLWKSTDGGATFVRIAGLDAAESVGFGKAAPGSDYPVIFTVARRNGKPGVFRSLDAGKSWVQINDAATGLGTMNEITGDPKKFGRVYLGTNGRGIFYGDPR